MKFLVWTAIGVFVAVSVLAYFPVNQLITLQNNAFASNAIPAYAEYAAFASSVSDPERGANPHFNAPMSFTDSQTGSTYSNLMDYCDTNTLMYHEIFGVQNGEVSITGLGPISNTTGLITAICPGNLPCSDGSCPCGQITQLSSSLPIQVGAQQITYLEGISVDNQRTVVTGAGNGNQGLYYYNGNLGSTVQLVPGSLANGVKTSLRFSFPNAIYIQQLGFFPPNPTPGLYLYSFNSNILTHMATQTNYANGTLEEFNPDIDESGRYIIWQKTVDFGVNNRTSHIYLYDLGGDLVFGSTDDFGPYQVTFGGAEGFPRITTLASTGIELFYKVSNEFGSSYSGSPYIEKIHITQQPFSLSQAVQVLNSNQLLSYDVEGDKIITLIGSSIAIRTLSVKNYQNLQNSNTLFMSSNQSLVLEKIDDNYVLATETVANGMQATVFNTITNQLSSLGIISTQPSFNALDIDYDPIIGTNNAYYVKDINPNVQAIFFTLLSYC